MALAAGALGQREAALDALEGALAAAGGEDLIWPFVVPGPQARALVAALIDRGTAHEALAVRVLAHLAPQHTARRSPHYLEPLTARELQVLHHLPGTHTNSQIAGQLFVSLNTLRTHMKASTASSGPPTAGKPCAAPANSDSSEGFRGQQAPGFLRRSAC